MPPNTPSNAHQAFKRFDELHTDDDARTYATWCLVELRHTVMREPQRRAMAALDAFMRGHDQ